MTIDYLRWAHFVALNKNMNATTRGVYQYIYCTALECGNPEILISQDQLATILSISKTKVSSSLKMLHDCKLILPMTGKIRILPPDPTWLDKYCLQKNTANDTANYTNSSTAKNSQFIKRAHEEPTAQGKSPLKGIFPETGERKPTNEEVIANAASGSRRVTNPMFLNKSTEELLKQFGIVLNPRRNPAKSGTTLDDL